MSSDVDLLLDRPYPQDYENDWAALSKQQEADYDAFYLKVLIFRIGEDWFGLESKVLKAVTEKKTVHNIPFSKGFIEGVSNIRGDLKPVVSFDALIEKKSIKKLTKTGFMILISQEGDDWVFNVDEVMGIFDVSPKDLQNVPVNVSKSYGNLIKGIINIGSKTVAILEEELLFYTLSRGFNAD